MAETKDNNGNTAQEQRKSRRDTFRERFATRHPDVNMDDEEAYYAALDDEYNSRDEELNRYRADNEKLNNMFLENPNAAYFMNDLLDGKKQMGVALMEHFGDLFKEAVNDPTPENVKAFADADIFHWSGIDASLTQGLADVCAEAISVAERMGVRISCDINYRKNLWLYGRTAEEVLLPLMRSSDIIFGSSGEYEKALGLKAPAFGLKSSAERIGTAEYEDYCSCVSERLPRCKYLFMCMRNAMTSEHHCLEGVLYTDGSLKVSPTYEVNNVVDSMGVGDAFVGAMLYAVQNYDDDQKKLDFAMAGSALKNTVVGDYNMVSADEVEALMRGGGAEMKR